MQREIAHNLATGERRTKDVAAGKVKTFPELNLRREIVLGLQRRNFLVPTMIQAAAIPIALSKKDLLIQSKSGTGKTLIYAIAALQGFDASIKTPQVVVVVPTRELAIQVKETFKYLGEFLPKMSVNYFIGGNDIRNDRGRTKNCGIVIGTPGRLLHLFRNNVLCVKNLNLIVLDEADQLYSGNTLRRQVIELMQKMPEKMQRIACSATYERNLDEQLAKTMYKPVLISNSERATVLLGIRQFVYELPRQINNIAQMNCKLDAVMKIFNLVPYEQVVLFASSKMRADSFRNYLVSRGVDCHLISGAMDQEERSKVFDCYRYFKMRTLVATDVFARGVDSPHTNLIVNLDPPMNHVDYLHRIGRAGRFGSKGIAITLVYEGSESEAFKGILTKAHTGKSVLEFPKEAEKGLDYWNFTAYNFPYYIKEEENQQFCEFPEKEGASASTEKKVGDAPLKKDALKEEKATAAGDSLKEMHASKEIEASANENDAKNASMKENTLKMVENHKEIIQKLAKKDTAATEEDSSKKKDTASIEADSSKKKDAAEEEKASPKKDISAAFLQPQMALHNQDKPEISVIACHKLKETIQDALMEDKLESSGEEEQPEQPQQLNSINNEMGKAKPDNACVKDIIPPVKDKADNVSLKELIPPGKDSHKELSPPTIKVTQLEKENDTEMNKENLPNNKNTQYPEDYISPELTPSSLTPLDLTQEQTLTPPAPPVNSINNKTYCLAAPTATSSLTLQAMVISNTVDDASSISSDGSMGTRSESYTSLYSTSDVKQIWKKFLINRKRLKRSAKSQAPKPLYNWSACKRVFRLKGKRKAKSKEIEEVETEYLLPEPKYFRLINKIEHSQIIAKGLINYSENRQMCDLEANLFVKQLYDAYNETYGWKSNLDSKKSKENKLSVRVAHRMNIPPEPAADEDPATGSEANEASVHSEEFTDNDDDFEEEEEEGEEEGNTSSGFVESNESVSSGIDTSVYQTDTSSEMDPYYPGDYSSGSGFLEAYYDWQREQESDDEDDYSGSNDSLAGSSYQESSSAEESEESEPEDEQNDMQQEPQAIYQQMFQSQYQFIVSHVASHLARP